MFAFSSLRCLSKKYFPVQPHHTALRRQCRSQTCPLHHHTTQQAAMARWVKYIGGVLSKEKSRSVCLHVLMTRCEFEQSRDTKRISRKHAQALHTLSNPVIGQRLVRGVGTCCFLDGSASCSCQQPGIFFCRSAHFRTHFTVCLQLVGNLLLLFVSLERCTHNAHV